MRRPGAIETALARCSCSCADVGPHQTANKFSRRESNPRMSKIASKSVLKRVIRSNSAGLRRLPEWDLDDLYRGLDDPAIKRDLDRTDAECVAFEEAYKGKLADLAGAADG